MVANSFLYDACTILTQDIDRLESLVKKLLDAHSWYEKEEIIAADSLVQEYLHSPSLLKTFLSGLSTECSYVLKAVIAIGQAEDVYSFEGVDAQDTIHRLRTLIDCLLHVEHFYKEMGGVVGYHLNMIKYLCRPDSRSFGDQVSFRSPPVIDISTSSFEVNDAICHAIESMKEIAEIYPVGGAADRLKLFDEKTGIALPAASLHFCGKTLLERLIVDVQVKEYLFFQFKNKQIRIPIAMMTSTEKNNHERILSLCEENQFFHRSKDDFFFFCQPSVPTITKEGKWALQGKGKLLLRPGGHGVIWKLAFDSGCFSWFKKKKIHKALVRQINNPIASEDYGLLAFCGFGHKNHKSIGFCSCPRLVKSAEGTNVLVEEKKDDAYGYTLTNIEYCDFAKYGIHDEPYKEGSPYSKYPSNTNILFVDLDAVSLAIEKNPVPGMLVNLKKIAFKDECGNTKEEPLARLESMMQNIADSFTKIVPDQLQNPSSEIDSYITFNERKRTISTTKREYVLGSSLTETPEGCFVDMMHNAKDLLSLCGFVIEGCEEDRLLPCLFLYHPALGPMHAVIAQKLRGGTIHKNSELDLQIADVDIESINLKGSLRVIASNVMGHIDEKGLLQYSHATGKCILQNVEIVNQGIDDSLPSIPWKGEFSRKESCLIEIQGDGEFVARNVCFHGNVHIVVPPSTRVEARQNGREIELIYHKIQARSWNWHYAFDEKKNIVLRRSY
jgi:hypothetical protein